MKKIKLVFLVSFLTWSVAAISQNKDSLMVSNIVKEATENSQLEKLAHELVDGIGPRLVGTPQMQKAHDWAVAKYNSWGISARNEKWGEWRGWERGITHIDMISPWVRSLEGTQLAWSPSTGPKGVTAETITLPDVEDSVAFQKWLPQVKGKFVLISMMQPTGRPDYNWEEFAVKESFEKMKEQREKLNDEWRTKMRKIGYSSRELPAILEKAGAAGLIASNWSRGFGVNKIFGANTKKIPTVDLSLEDYGLLYRLTESGNTPKLTIRAESKFTGMVPTFNTIAEIKGTE